MPLSRWQEANWYLKSPLPKGELLRNWAMYSRTPPAYSHRTRSIAMNGDQMKYLLWMLVLSAATQAQSFTASGSTSGSPTVPPAPVVISEPFLTVENNVSLSILAGLVAADAITTQRGLNEGLREVNPIMRPFVTRGAAGEAAGSALGFGAAVGVAYLLHCTHHYKAERVTMRLMIAGEAGFVSNNIMQIR